MRVKNHAKMLRNQGLNFQREYNGHLIHRAGHERTFTVWQNGRCRESGLKTFVNAMDWIEENPPRF